MLFRRNEGEAQRIWVDQGIDGRVDDSPICRPCDDALREDDPRSERWHDANALCMDCRQNIAGRALLGELGLVSRPFNGMLEDRVITNDEFNQEPHAGGGLNYYFPE